MKHLTILFCKVLSGLFQQGIVTNEKKDMLLTAWQDSVKNQNTKTMKKLLTELISINTNMIWKKELNEAIEELS